MTCRRRVSISSADTGSINLRRPGVSARAEAGWKTGVEEESLWDVAWLSSLLAMVQGSPPGDELLFLFRIGSRLAGYESNLDRSGMRNETRWPCRRVASNSDFSPLGLVAQPLAWSSSFHDVDPAEKAQLVRSGGSGEPATDRCLPGIQRLSGLSGPGLVFRCGPRRRPGGSDPRGSCGFRWEG